MSFTDNIRTNQDGQSLEQMYRIASNVILITVITLIAPGCGSSADSDADTWSEEVDSDLSADDQARLNALRDVLIVFQEENSFEFLGQVVPLVDFQESREEFLEGMFDLHRWKFDGPPQGNDVPVILYMREDNPPDYPEKKVERTYTVKKTRNKFTVRRKR